MPRVTELWTYPVKSCAGVSQDETLLTPAGLAHDRTFLVTRSDGTSRTQRRDPVLAKIRPRIDTDGARLVLETDGVPSIQVDVDLDAARRDVRLFDASYAGIDQGDAVADWLTRVVGAPSRLVRVPPEHDRVTDGLVAGTSAYADSCAVHLLSLSSLAGLNASIAAGGASPVPMARFRPNVVAGGWDEPHVEDRVRELRVGAAVLGYAKPAIRCVITMVDQDSGAKVGPEPLRSLSRYRRDPQGGVSFGVKLVVVRPGKLSVGDEIVVERWASS